MTLRRTIFACIGIFALIPFLFARDASALSLHVVRDLISTSQKATTADHLITFTATQSIPAGGRIYITPAPGAFTIPSDLGVDDIDFARASTSTYNERNLATTSDAVTDGVSIVSGANGSITITLNDSDGVDAGDRLAVRIGSDASYEAVGNQSITNPVTTGSYRVHLATTNGSGVPIDVGDAMIAIVEQVNVSVRPINLAPVRANGSPSGVIAAGTKAVEISLTTDQISTCKYSRVASTTYAAMTDYLSPTLAKFFSVVVTGFQDDQTYNFYVRCESVQHTANTDDYLIQFKLAPTPSTNLSLPEGTPTGSGAVGRGSGDFVNGSQSLYLASVSIVGWTIPLSTVSVLVDGVQHLTAQAKSDGSFRSDVTGLERGTHTVVAYATDSTQHRSAGFTSTLTLESGTNNLISDAVIPPTIIADKTSIGLSDDLHIHGESAPGTVEIAMIQQSDAAKPPAPKIYTATTTAASPTSRAGAWEYTISSRDLGKGTYLIKARTIYSTSTNSEYGKSIAIGVGKSAPSDVGNRSDINKDGKVNLVDFSIMLAAWSTSDADADINQDGTVNLADFSIMLFNWTG